MISEDGNIFIIDYGFIMGEEPKKLGNYIIAPEIKWTQDMSKPILHNEKEFSKPMVFKDARYKELLKACCEGFILLRSIRQFL